MIRPAAVALVTLALAAPAAAQQRGGAFPAGERYVEPQAFAPAQESRYHVQAVTLDKGATRVRVPASGTGRLLVWTIPVGDAKLRTHLQAPDGRSLRADESRSAREDVGRAGFAAPDLGLAGLRGGHEVVYVDNAAAGGHDLDVEGSGAALVVAAEPDSALTLRTTAGPLSRQPGQPVVLRADLRDGATAVTGAQVAARLSLNGGRAGAPVTLHDDGRHQDGAADDGVYGAVVRSAPNAAGALDVRFEASGRDGRGSTFARTSGSTVVNEPGTAKLSKVTTSVVRGQGLVVTAVADVATGGRYRLDVIVAGAASGDGVRPALAWSEDAQRLSAGRRTLRLVVPAEHLPTLGLEPILVDVRLLGYDPVGVAGRATVETR